MKIILSITLIFACICSVKAQNSNDIEDSEHIIPKNYWVEVGIGVNFNNTQIFGNDFMPSSEQFATNVYKVLIGKKILPKAFLTFGYYSTNYEYSFKSSTGQESSESIFNNTSSRIPINFRYELFSLNFRKSRLSLYGESGFIVESVSGKNNVQTTSTSMTNESFNSGLYGLVDFGGGFSFKFGKALGITIGVQKTYGFKPFMQKEYFSLPSNGDKTYLGTAAINGTGYNMNLGVQYYF